MAFTYDPNLDEMITFFTGSHPFLYHFLLLKTNKQTKTSMHSVSSICRHRDVAEGRRLEDVKTMTPAFGNPSLKELLIYCIRHLANFFLWVGLTFFLSKQAKRRKLHDTRRPKELPKDYSAVPLFFFFVLNKNNGIQPLEIFTQVSAL